MGVILSVFKRNKEGGNFKTLKSDIKYDKKLWKKKKDYESADKLQQYAKKYYGEYTDAEGAKMLK